MAFVIGIDVGGTFTDFLFIDEASGEQSRLKSPSTPSDPSVAVMRGLTTEAANRGLALEQLTARTRLIVHGTTVATNAVLTGRGARTGLLTTEGFRDVLEMRRGIRSRDHLYDNTYVAPPPLIPRQRRLPVRERLDIDGRVLVPLDRESVAAATERLVADGVEAIAICFMHSYANGMHEREARDLVRELAPGVEVSISSEVLPQVRLYDRASTVAMNAYVGPVIKSYIEQLMGRLAGSGFAGSFLIMRSSGGVGTPESILGLPASTVMSGPAAGPVAALRYAQARGLQDCILMDMGGTSFEASMVQNGHIQLTREGELNRHRVALAMTAVNSIGAGGGSIARVDDRRLLTVGPDSAGADPGPAAYGRGGEEPTVTDAALVLGYLDPAGNLAGGVELRMDLAAAAIRRYVAEPLGLTVEQAAAGIFELVNLSMATGIKDVSIKRGHDPRDFPLVVAGGAGALHAGEIARELGIRELLVPRAASVLCAMGMLAADLRHDFVSTFRHNLGSVPRGELRTLIDDLSRVGVEALLSEGVESEFHEIHIGLDLRYVGQHHELEVPVESGWVDGDLDAIASAFHAIHHDLYGFSRINAEIECLNLRVAVLGRTERDHLVLASSKPGAAAAEPVGSRMAWVASQKRKVPVPVYCGDDMSIGHPIVGPALVQLETTTVVVPEGFEIADDGVADGFVMTLR